MGSCVPPVAVLPPFMNCTPTYFHAPPCAAAACTATPHDAHSYMKYTHIARARGGVGRTLHLAKAANSERFGQAILPDASRRGS